MQQLRPTRTVRTYTAPSSCDEVLQRFSKKANPPDRFHNFKPYWQPHPYLEDLKKNGTNTEELEKLYNEHPPLDDKLYETKPKKNLNMKPLGDLYEKYSKPARVPPIEERIKALHQCGYSNEDLLTVMRQHDARLAAKPELDKFLFDIFGDHTEKKTASVKKKSIYQILKIKKQTFAMPEPDEEELPNEDAAVDDDVDV
jgi:hypothetical protein